MIGTSPLPNKDGPVRLTPQGDSGGGHLTTVLWKPPPMLR